MMEDQLNNDKLDSEPTLIRDSPLPISVISSTNPQKHISEFLDHEEVENHAVKLDRLRQEAPRFTNDLKFWPIFDTKILCKYSFVFHYYYEVSLFLIKLFIIMMILTVIYYIINHILDIHQHDIARFWFFFGYGFLTIIIVRLYSIREEKKVLGQPNVQTEDWTENKFALMVENIPLEVSKDEIKRFFEDKIQENGYKENVKEIMLLQECDRYLYLEKKLRKESYANKKRIGLHQSLIENVAKLRAEKMEILNSVENFQLYRGTAIVLFETVRGKITIENYFRLNFAKKILYSLLPLCFGKRYRLQGKIPKVKEAPEPSDFIFEKVYVLRSKIRFRKYLSYFLGSLIVLVGIGIIVIVRLGNNDKNLASWLHFPIYIYSSIIIVATLAIYLFTDYLLEHIMIFKKRSECELQKVKFRLIVSYLSINAYLVVLMQFVPNFEVCKDQILLTTLLLAGLIPLRKIFSVISIKKFRLRRRLYREPCLLEKYSRQEVIDIFTNPEYDFANNIEDSVCFMFITLGFYSIGQLYVIGITFVAFVISVCVDKLVMVYLTSPTTIRGSEMGLEFFRILRWDIRLQLLTLAFFPTDMAFTAGSMPFPLKVVLIASYGVFLFWDFRGNVRKSWKNKWSKERENTKYVDVENFFAHKYKAKYPFEIY